MGAGKKTYNGGQASKKGGRKLNRTSTSNMIGNYGRGGNPKLKTVTALMRTASPDPDELFGVITEANEQDQISKLSEPSSTNSKIEKAMAIMEKYKSNYNNIPSFLDKKSKEVERNTVKKIVSQKKGVSGITGGGS